MKKRKEKSLIRPYIGAKNEWDLSRPILKENVVRWIKTSPLDAKDTASPEVISNASRIPKRHKQ